MYALRTSNPPLQPSHSRLKLWQLQDIKSENFRTFHQRKSLGTVMQVA